MSNERLRGSILTAGLTPTKLADTLGVDPKSVERWISKERLPHRNHRMAVAGLLGVAETYLWPATADDPRTRSASRAELVEFFPCRSAVPAAKWIALAEDAVESFDLLAYGALFLPEQFDFVNRLVERAEAGVRVRVLLGDPRGEAVARRGQETRLGSSVASRVSLSISYFREAVGVPGLEVRLHDTTLYTSIYRGDDDILANTQVFGSPAAQSPVLHLRRVPGGRVFDHYVRSFERVWITGEPLTRAYTLH